MIRKLSGDVFYSGRTETLLKADPSNPTGSIVISITKPWCCGETCRRGSPRQARAPDIRGDVGDRRLLLGAQRASLEQHPALEQGRAEKRIAALNVVGDVRIMDPHQADRLRQMRVRPRLANHLMMEHPPIKRLMLGAYRGERIVSGKIAAGKPTQAQRHIWQSAMNARNRFISDEARGIDNDFAVID